MALSDLQCKNAKPKDKPFKIADERGLFLQVMPNGSKWWRFSYRFDLKQKTLSMGTYPDTGLREAREKRDSARKLLAAGVDPGENRKAVKAARLGDAANSFEVVAREWFAQQEPNWAPTHSGKIIRRLELDVFPWIGRKAVTHITAPDVLAVLRRIEARGAIDTAHRAQQNCGQVFRYAIATGRAVHNPVPNLKGALRANRKKHYAAMTDPKDVAKLLRAIDDYEGSLVTKCALRLAPLVFVRPGELRSAEWAEINLETCEWNIPAVRMKMREPHLVPLSTQAVAILKELKPLTGDGKYVFPGARGEKARPMSNNTMLGALRRMGFSKDEMTGHGFRAMARTILDEILEFRPDYIEHQLAHAVRDPNGRAYNRTAHKVQRQQMMQAWADYLDKLKGSAA